VTGDVYVSPDQRLSVAMTDDARERLIKHCIRAGRRETGGVLLGSYSSLHDHAMVSEVTGPPKDSVRRRWSFVRGIAGVQRRIDRAWRRERYYLGEWHFHPYTSPAPSDRDKQQVRDFAVDPAYACPEPILVVVGGNPSMSPSFAVALVVEGKFIVLEEMTRSP